MVGSATPVNLFPPKATSSAAAPNPLNGILVLSNLVLSTVPTPIVVDPVLSIVTSPVTGTAVATFNAFPIMMLLSLNADPMGVPTAIGDVVTVVILPFASTVILGTAVADP